MSENLPAKQGKVSLPTLQDLYDDKELATKLNDLNKLLNAQPRAEWVKINAFANNSKYLPIERVEYLLTSIYIKWRVEIKSCQVIANSCVTILRLFVLDPITGEWDWQDGIGASPIQTAKGAAATDFTQVNTAAVQMAAPASESMAFKDAAEKFGKLFGKDLNRKDEINYAPMQEAKFKSSDPDPVIPIPQELRDAISLADVPNLSAIFNTNKGEFGSNPEFMQLLTARKIELRTPKSEE
jgi:hypothetical protein